ncbi:MAG: hypothetical protein ACRBFS_23025 [Aureispira sp.]
MTKQNQLSLETYVISLSLIERLDELEDSSKKGVKYLCKKLIKELEAQDKTLSEMSANAAEVLSGGFNQLITEVIKGAERLNEKIE